MKKRFYSFLALFLSVILLLSACGQQTVVPQQPTTVPDEPAAASNTPVTISLMVSGEPMFNPTPDSYLLQLLGEKLGIKFDVILAEWGTLGDKLSLRLASDDLPDLFRLEAPAAASTGTIDFAIEYGSKGMLLPFDKYLDDGKMPNLKDWLDKYPDIRQNLTAPDGHMYVVPQFYLLVPYSPALLMRADYLEECGIVKDRNDPAASYQNITTVDDLYEAFKCLYDKNGGKPVLSQRNGLVQGGVWNNWATWFGTSQGIYYNPKTSQYEYGPLMKRYRVAVEFVNRLYNEGILHADWATMSDADWSALFDTGDAPAALEWHAWNYCFLNERGVDVGKDFYVQSLTIDGERIQWSKPTIDGGSYMAISAKSSPEKIDAAIRLLDYLYSPEGAVLGWFGQEGVDWKIENGERCQTGSYAEENPGDGYFCEGKPPSSDTPVYFGLYLRDWSFLRVYEVGMLPEWSKTRAPAICPDRWNYAQDQFENSGSMTAAPNPTVTLNEEERAISSELGTVLDTYVMEETQKFIEGKRPLTDEEWTKFTSQVEQLGAQKVVDAYNAALSRVKK